MPCLKVINDVLWRQVYAKAKTRGATRLLRLIKTSDTVMVLPLICIKGLANGRKNFEAAAMRFVRLQVLQVGHTP